MAIAKGKVVAEIASRLRDRRLFKAIEIFDDSLLDEARESKDEDFLNKITDKLAQILDIQERSGAAEAVPSMMIDRVHRPLYKEFDKSKGPLNQMMIRTRDNELRDVADVSRVIRAIGDFEGLRVYIAPSDTKSSGKIMEAVKEAIDYARAN